MKKLTSSVIASSMAASVLLTGCGNSVGTETKSAEEAGIDMNVKASDIANIKPLSFEEIEAENVRSQSDIENTVYQYVSDSIMVDTSNLVSVTDGDMEDQVSAINNIIENINKGLATGEVPDGFDETMMNYMLLKFSNTPYNWNVTNVDIKGMDAQTRLFFVDVTYKTNSSQKELIPDSIIVKGSENEEELLKTRYTDYMIWINDQIEGSDSWAKKMQKDRSNMEAMQILLDSKKNKEVMDGYEADVSVDEKTDQEIIDEAYGTYVGEDGTVYSGVPTWEDKWGNLQDIFDTQNNLNLLDRVARASSNDKDIGVVTYPGLTEVAADHGAEMTFRFVLKNTYNIGLENSMKVQSVYLYNYQLDDEDSLIAKYTTDTVLNGDVLAPYIERTIKSFRKSIDESNHIGLNKLCLTYAKYDTYISNLNDYAYTNSGGFNYEIIGRKGNELAVIVNQRNKERAKGTYMTMPTYMEKVLMKVKLCEDDTIKIVSFTTLKSDLVGEPLSVIRDVTGISEKIAYTADDFTVSNQAAVEEVIKNFTLAQLQYNGVADSTFWDVVDIGVSATEKQKMYDLFQAVKDIGATKSTVWLTGYESKSNLYVTCKLREVYEGTEENYDTESTLGIFYRDGGWKVISYSRNLAVKTQKGAVKTTNCLVEADINAAEKAILHTQISADLRGNIDTSTNDAIVTGVTGTDENTGFDDVAYTTSATEATSDTSVEGDETATEAADTPAETEAPVSEDNSDDPLAGLFD